MGKLEIWPINQSSPKVAHVIRSWISTDMQNLVTIPRGVSFPVCTKLCIKNVYSASFFSVLPTPHSRGPRTDFQAKYIKWRGSTRARMCLFWVINFFLHLNPIFQKYRNFWVRFWQERKIFSRKPLYNGGCSMLTSLNRHRSPVKVI